MSKLTPQQAYEHIKALFPSKEVISIHSTENGNVWVHEEELRHSGKPAYFSIGKIEIDWPEGVDRWPPMEEWVDAVMPQDYGKPCRHRDDHESWKEGVLVGESVVRNAVYRWITEHPVNGTRYDSQYCQVRVEPEKATAPITRPAQAESIVEKQPDGDIWTDVYSDGLPIETAPKDREIELLMGGKWRKGRWHSCQIWMTVSPEARLFSWDRANQPTRWKPL